MKRMIMMTLAILVASTSLWAAKSPKGTEAMKTEVRKVASFEKISITGSVDVVYKQGNTQSVKVVAPARIINKITTSVANRTLEIGLKSNSFNGFNFYSDDDVKVYVTSPDLIGVFIKGSGDFEAKSKIDSDNFALSIMGSGDTDIDYLICDNFRVELRGSGDVEIDHLRCATSSISLRGSGDIEISQDRVKNTNIELYGSGDIKVKSANCGVINCRVLGSGDVSLSGSATQLNQSVRGSGDISTSGLRLGRR